MAEKKEVAKEKKMTRKKVLMGVLAGAVLLCAISLVVYVYLGIEREKKVEKPKKVPSTLARQIIEEQQRSRVNLRRLAEGQVKNIAVGKVRHEGENKAVAEIVCTYIDDSLLEGTVELIRYDGYWYATTVTRKVAASTVSATGQAVSASMASGDGEISQSESKLADRIVDQQQKNQGYLVKLVEGEIENIEIKDVEKETSETTVWAALTYSDGSVVDSSVEMIYQDGFWYLVSFAKKPA